MKISKHEKAVKAAAKKARAALNELIPRLIVRRVNALFCMTTNDAGEPGFNVAEKMLCLQRVTHLTLALEEAMEKNNQAINAWNAGNAEESVAIAAHDEFNATLTSTAKALMSQLDLAIQLLMNAEKNLENLLDTSHWAPFWIKLQYAYEGVLTAMAMTPDVAPEMVVRFVESYREFVASTFPAPEEQQQ
jgi:hypothetical protein